MRGWRGQYRTFAGPRYPGLVGYAQLLTGSQKRADALAAFALRRAFGKWRRGTDVQLEAKIRRLIVARFLVTAESDDPPVVRAGIERVGSATRAASPESTEPSAPPEQPRVDASVYAPPGHATSQTLEFLHAGVTPEADVADGDSHAPPEPHQSQVRAEVEMVLAGEAAEVEPARVRETSVQSEPNQLPATLAMLTPRARVIVVLRHFDGLVPALIATQLDMEHDQVIKELRASYSILRSHLGVTIPDEPDHAASPAGDGAHQVVVTSHVGRR